jgi:hypothetical protein
LEAQTYFGFSSYAISIYREFGFGREEFRLPDAFFKVQDASLLEAFLYLTGTSGRLEKSLRVDSNVVADKDRLFPLVFGDSAPAELAKSFILSRYAYQSLYVKDPEIYLKASIRTPRALELARTLKNKDTIFDWIKTHVSYGSIFEDSSDRIMTADEVIVFRKGSLKDQAVLASSLLKLRGYNPQISITGRDAFVTVGNETYDAKTWSQIASVDGDVILKLSL